MSIASKSTIIPLLYPEIARSIERISKTNRSKADITETIIFDYVWDGNNISKSTETGGSSVVYETTYKYDKNKNPKYYYYLTGDFDPSTISKNNITNSELITQGGVFLQENSYIYEGKYPKEITEIRTSSYGGNSSTYTSTTFYEYEN